MKVLVVMYWVWFGISVVVLTRRAIRRIFGRSGTRPGPATPGATAGPTLIDSLEQRVQERTAVAAAAGVLAPTEPPATADAAAPAEHKPALPQPARSSIAGARTTLADALAGIAMPAGLVPLTLVSRADMVRRAVFATTATTIERADAEVLAELERLGYDLDRVGPHTSLARRGDDALALRFHVIGPQPKKGPADANYPTAPAGSVVLDVELT